MVWQDLWKSGRAHYQKSIGLTSEANQLTVWLKSELEDWFTAETDGVLDEQRYFVYDDTWDTLLGVEEATDHTPGWLIVFSLWIFR